MNIYLLRHAIAVEPALPDHGNDRERPLTARGKARMRRIARAMKALGLSFDVILSSSYVRARETAEIVADTLGMEGRLKCVESLTPRGSRQAVISEIRAEHGDANALLLIGHEPFLSNLISTLVSGDSTNSMEINLKRGGLCNLSVETLTYSRCARLEWLLAPRHLVHIGSTRQLRKKERG